MRLLAWLNGFVTRLFLGGENQIAIEYRGEEAIHEEEWSRLPEEERGRWEAVDEYPELYRRKRELW